MDKTRRALLIAPIAYAALGMESKNASGQSLHPENQRAAESLYGTRIDAEFRKSSKLLLEFQNQRTAPPGKSSEVSAYLQNLPLIRKMEADIAAGLIPSQLYYIVQWNHFALDLTALDHTKYVDANDNFDPSWASQSGGESSREARNYKLR